MAKQIELTQGFIALVDDIDFEYLRQFKWCISKGYAVRHGPHNSTISMHRVILERMLGRKMVKGEVVDHADGQRSNNTRKNLRLASQSQNIMNKPKFALNASSRFKGVCRHKVSGKWQAQIKIDGHLNHLGTFLTEEEAAKAYDQSAWLQFGGFAELNFPNELEAHRSLLANG